VTNDECVALARRLARAVAEELKIPTYLYELAAARPDRTDLAVIRKGEFEGLREEIKKDPFRKPDFGPSELHPTAGASVIGARFTAGGIQRQLNTANVDVAKKIAKALRFKDGGFRYCKSLGFEIKEKNCAQVSINIPTSPAPGSTGLRVRQARGRALRRGRDRERDHRACRSRRSSTPRYGTCSSTASTPADAGDQARPRRQAADRLARGAGGPHPHPRRRLGLGALRLHRRLAALHGLRADRGQEGIRAVSAELNERKAALDPMRGKFHALIDKDAAAFDQVMAAYKLPKATDEERPGAPRPSRSGHQGRLRGPGR
jgi:hypothetical protein